MADTAQIVRDILLSVYLAGGILFTLVLILIAFLLYKGVKGLLNSINHVTDNVGEFSDLAVENLVTPMKEGVSFSNAVGNTFGFMTGFVAGMRGGRDRKRDRDDKGRERERRRRR